MYATCGNGERRTRNEPRAPHLAAAERSSADRAQARELAALFRVSALDAALVQGAGEALRGARRHVRVRPPQARERRNREVRGEAEGGWQGFKST